MADITKNTYDPTKRYDKIIFQKGRDVLDAELNELQDNARGNVGFYQTATSMHGFVGYGLRVDGAGAVNAASVRAGEMYWQGDRYAIASNTTLSALGVTLTNADPGVDRYDYIYVELQEVEVGPGTDPNIAIAVLGETALRAKLNVTWKVATGTTPPVSDVLPLFQGGVHRVPVARLYRPAGDNSIQSYYVLDLRQSVLAQSAAAHIDYTARLDPNVAIRWNTQDDELSIALPNDGTSASDGLRITWPTGVQSIVQGAFEIPNAGDALWIIPRRFASTEAAEQQFSPNAGTPEAGVYAVGPLSSVPTDGTAFVVARRSTNNGVVLWNGQVLENDGGANEVVTLSDGLQVMHRNPVMSIGTDASAYSRGQFEHNSFDSSLADVIACLVTNDVVAPVTTEVLVRAGSHAGTITGGATTHTIDLSSAQGSRVLVFKGEGVDVSRVVVAPDATKGTLMEILGPTDGNYSLDIEFRDITFVSSDLSRRATLATIAKARRVVFTRCRLEGFDTDVQVFARPDAKVLVDGCEVYGNNQESTSPVLTLSGDSSGAIQPMSVTVTNCRLQAHGGGASHVPNTALHIVPPFAKVVTRKNTFLVPGDWIRTGDTALLHVDDDDVNAALRSVVIEDNEFVFESGVTSYAEGAIYCQAGKNVRIRHNLVDGETTDGSGFQVPTIWCQMSGTSGNYHECIDVSDNTFRVDDWARGISGAGAGFVLVAGDESLSYVENLRINNNKVGITGAFTYPTTTRGPACIFVKEINVGGGEINGNVIRANAPMTGDCFVGISVNSGFTDYDTVGLHVTNNTVLAPWAETATAGGKSYGVTIGQALRCTVSDNTLRLGTTSLTDCFAVDLPGVGQSTVVSNNVMEAFRPISWDGSDHYGTGNITLDCDDPSNVSGTSTNSTFSNNKTS